MKKPVPKLKFKPRYPYKLSITNNLARTLSKMGACSRKQAVQLIQEGQVSVNGQVVKNPGWRVKPEDVVTLKGQKVYQKKKIYLVLNKPSGYITTRSDEKGRKTVYEFLTDLKEWVFPIGRLDQETEGILLFTNDTAFGDRLTDPKEEVPRTYHVVIEGKISEEELLPIKKGMDIGGGERSQPAEVKILSIHPSNALLEITLKEGKNREVRRIFEKLGKKIHKLIRTDFGPFHLGRLKPGEWRPLTPPPAWLR